MIALTGDFVTDEGDLAAVEKLVARLTELCPVYFVSGNHEFGSGLAVKVRNILERAGVKYLSNEYLTISAARTGYFSAELKIRWPMPTCSVPTSLRRK